MTGSVPASSRRFPATTLPWIIAACAVAAYALTLNSWISFSSVAQVAEISGWIWEPSLTAPLYYLITLPLRALPAHWVPAALNMLNAVFAAATLGLLARTVAILPHNRTHDQRLRVGPQGDPLAFRSAWLPPVLAVAVCGLQLTFWEHATAGTPNMLNLLLFAYIIRCLMEFRLDGRHRWLWQSAFLTGVGMANSYAFVGFWPLYLISVIWLKRIAFFDGRFLLRMALLGLAGMSLYLLLPILQAQSALVESGFLEILKFTLATQKALLFEFPRRLFLFLSLTSLVPVLLISIRWPQSFGELSPQGVWITTLLFNVVHVVFLLACIWIAFDPPVSPRHLGFGRPFLTFYYLSAIAIGYFTGYLLVIFGQGKEQTTYTYGRNPRSSFSKPVVVAVWGVAALAVVGLGVRNLPQIRMTNSSMLRDYASLIADQIPEGKSVVLCDDPAREFVLRSALTQRRDRPEAMLLSTRALVWPRYHTVMAEEHPGRWPATPPTNTQTRLVDEALLNLVILFSQSNQICYAHPSFGFYFEAFHPEPAGILNKLRPYKRGELLPDPLDEATKSANERFWEGSALRLLETVHEGIRLGDDSASTATGGKLLSKLRLNQEPNQTAVVLGRWLSRSLNSYGVELQRAGYLEEAARRFEQATVFNPNNIAANVNLQFNANLQANQPSGVKITQSIEEQFEKYPGTQKQILEQVINDFGLFDEPHFTWTLAEHFVASRLFRQGLIEFDRATRLLPDELIPKLWCAQLASRLRAPDAALEIVNEIRDQPQRFRLTSANESQLVFVEATARITKGDTDSAMNVIETAIASAPDDTNLVNSALKVLTEANMFSNALTVLEAQLATRPEDVNLLVNKGFVLLRLTNHEPAVDVLTQALKRQSNNAFARLNRAYANLSLGHYDKAKADYETLLLRFPKLPAVYFGLGEVAFHQKDTNQAIHNYRLYLTNAPPNAAEARLVRERLENLDGNVP